jgi:epoxyqueuosine reductase
MTSRDKKASDTSVVEALNDLGLQSAIFPVERVFELFGELAGRAERGEISSLLLGERYLSHLAVEPPEVPGWALSVILVSMAQPIGRFRFRHDRGSTWAIVPPQYRENQDESVAGSLRRILGPDGFRAMKARIPFKLAAARCGLGEYGRNNILFTKENGSFHRLAAFYSDLPCGGASWRDPVLMKACTDCRACLEHCPTGCIVNDRFIVRGERCLTFHNEDPQPLPGWIDPRWSNALVGCMRCQSVCPVDRPVLARIETWDTFSESETAILLSQAEASSLPVSISRRLDRVGLGDYIPVLGRNLRLLIDR